MGYRSMVLDKKPKKITRVAYRSAIRKKCMDCCCSMSKEVKLCPAEDCPLWAFRMGGDFRVGEILEDVKTCHEDK